MHTPSDPLADLFASTDPLPDSVDLLGRLGDELDILEVRRGGMGEVFICRYRNRSSISASIGVIWACKTFRRQFFFKPHVRAAYLREVRIWSRLGGVPHIMPVMGFQIIEDRPFVFMPAVLGRVRSLRDVVSAGSPDRLRAASLAAQVALGMHLAGERVTGLVHGDLKPENVLLQGDVVYISDFGLARAADDNHRILGTPAYQAPEMIADPASASVASDIYAFGILMWELLTGSRPHEGDPLQEPDSGFAALAKKCISKDPGQRPASFSDIYLAILNIAGHDVPSLTAQIMTATARVRLELEILAPALAEARVKSLTNLEEYDLAVEEADALPEFLVTPTTTALRGHALASLGRDEEAIASFDRVLAGNPSKEPAVMSLTGKGLSLKHLGRYDEAIEILHQTVVDLSGRERGEALMNLATAYLEQGEPSDALPLLLQASKLCPDTWQVWCNLGKVYEEIGDYQSAEVVYRQAVNLAPSEVLPAMLLVALCMDHLGKGAVAWAVLEQLREQGNVTVEWAVRAMAYLLAGGAPDEELDEFASQVSETWPEYAADIIERAHRLAANLSISQESVAAALMPEDNLVPAVAGDPIANLRSVLPDGWEMSADQPGEPEPLSDPRVASGYAAARDGQLFLGIRVYMTAGFYCFDFFGPPEHPDYLNQFAESLTKTRGMIEIGMSHCRRREIPPYYHRCPTCSVLVLTDRTPGVQLRCRSCAENAPTHPLKTPEFADLVQKAASRLGYTINDVSGEEQLLLAELPADELTQPAAILASQLGFEHVDKDAPAPKSLLRHIRSRRMPGFGDWGVVVAFRKTAGLGVQGYVGSGTPDLEELEFLLRATVGVRFTVSTHYGPAGASCMAMELTGRHEGQIEALRAKVALNPHDPNARRMLAMLCVDLGRLEEADEVAKVCIERWPEDPLSWLVCASVRRDKGDLVGAIDAAQQSLALDPVQPVAFKLLSLCHSDLGNEDAARSAASQAFGLGGA
ncbi:MAG: protein kinase domain-containing protein [Streptosporangiaceae bacterium]